MSDELRYTGKIQPPDGAKDERGCLLPYLPDDGLVEVVNLAIALQRPLLLKGEPGCGKTRLGPGSRLGVKLGYQPWYVKSTSRARDGLYTYDALGRLRDVQLVAASRATEKEAARAADPAVYVRFGPLGEALRGPVRTVVLIDEIDKADIDFPNDLLEELDERRFKVEETGQVVVAPADRPPIVFITSNDEKDLPDAFLRRCLFHYVEFPAKERLIQIVAAHFPQARAQVVDRAVERFRELRQAMLRDKGEAGKRASTSELIDWFRALSTHRDDEALALLGGRLPYPSVLLKSWDDHQRYLAAGAQKGRP